MASWFDPLFRTEGMRRVFGDAGRLQRMLDFEAALARAEARAGVIPAAAAKVIGEQCRAARFDLGELSRGSAAAGNSAIPVIQELTRLVAGVDPAAAQYVHWGATSQDAMDTGLVLQLRQGLVLIETDTQLLCAELMTLAMRHKEAPMAGRTWLQHAAPTTFGLKVAGWLSALARGGERLFDAGSRATVLQMGGAVGTLASLGTEANKTLAFLEEELALKTTEVPWHVQRDRLVDVAAALGVLVGTLGKIARDIALMSQSEVGEVAEGTAPGRGGSSSMPQKRNPVGCAAVLATATRMPGLVSTMLAAMVQEHERGLGGWQAEWEVLPEMMCLTAGALAQMRQIIGGLRVDTDRMRENLEVTRGLIYAEAVSGALAKKIGHAAAHAVVERACRRAAEEGRHLREVVSGDAEILAYLAAGELGALFEPEAHVRAAVRLVERAMAAAAAYCAGSRKEGE